MASAEFTANFIATQIAARPLEATIVRKIAKAMRDNGTPITSIEFGEEPETVKTTSDILNLAFNLDELYLITADDRWIKLTMGEGLDIMCDYCSSLEEALTPVTDWIESKY